MKKYFLLVLSVAALSSCSTYKHSYRLSDVPQNKIGVTSIVVDVETDFEKTVRASSDRPTTSVADAKANAYFNAITDNDIDVLVDPIYSVRVTRGLFATTAKAEVTGFAGKFVNPRSESDAKQEAYDAKLAALEDFLEMKAIVNEDKPTNIVTACCGEGKGSSQTMTFNGAPALMDQFNAFTNGKIEQRNNLNLVSSAPSVVAVGKQNEGVFGQNLSSTRRGALIGTSIRWAPAYGVVGTASRVDYFITNELSIGTNFMVYQNASFLANAFGPSLQYFFTEKVFTQINVDIYQQFSFDGASFARWGLLNLDAKLGYWQKIGDNVAVAPMLNIGYYPGIELGLAINI